VNEILNHLLKFLLPAKSSNEILPADFPPMDTSKKTFGLLIFSYFIYWEKDEKLVILDHVFFGYFN